MLSAGALRAHLLAARLAGPVTAARERSLHRYRLFAARDPRALAGLEPEGEWPLARLLPLMAAECGVSPDPRRVSGTDRIDPDRTIAALDFFAERLAEAMARRTPVLIGTGRPRRLLRFYATLAAALGAAGCDILTPAYQRSIDITTRFGLRPYRLDYLYGVAVVSEVDSRTAPEIGGVDTYSPLPLRAALDGAVRSGGPVPGLVIGDHGWLCGAGQLGIEAIGPASSDDPAAFVGRAEGQIRVTVPVYDGVYPDYYRPLTRYVLNKVLP